MGYKMKKNKKRGQVAEFVGMAVLVLLVIVYAIFTKLSSAETVVSAIQRETRQSINLQVSTGAVILPYKTVEGIPLNELLGYAACYRKTLADYGGGIEINIDLEVKEVFDDIYGGGNWMVELNAEDKKNFCLTSELESGECESPANTVFSYDLILPLPCEKKPSKAVLYVGDKLTKIAPVIKKSELKPKYCTIDYPKGSHCKFVEGAFCGQDYPGGPIDPEILKKFYKNPVPTPDCIYGCCVKRR